MCIRYLIALLCCALSTPASAASVEEALAGCQPPPVFEEHHYPGEDVVANTNNLRRDAGSAFNAPGTPIIIKGKILDEHCAPISGARIDMWQANSAGKLLTPSDPEDFLGSGRSHTNNLGEFTFLTVMPGVTKEGSAPHVNFGVISRKFAPVYTRMYFPESTENANDKALQKAAKKHNPFGVPHVREGHDTTYYFNMQMKAGKAERMGAAEEESAEEEVIYDIDEEGNLIVITPGDDE